MRDSALVGVRDSAGTVLTTGTTLPRCAARSNSANDEGWRSISSRTDIPVCRRFSKCLLAYTGTVAALTGRMPVVPKQNPLPAFSCWQRVLESDYARSLTLA